MIKLTASVLWTIASLAQQAPTPASPPAQAVPPAKSPAPAQAVAPAKKKIPKDTARVPKFESRLDANADLSSRVQALLPKGGTLQDAAKGFKSETAFIATLHASHDLNIPFDQLKREVISSEHNSLAQAIRKFRPELGMKVIENGAIVAERQAKTDMKETRGPRR